METIANIPPAVYLSSLQLGEEFVLAADFLRSQSIVEFMPKRYLKVTDKQAIIVGNKKKYIIEGLVIPCQKKLNSSAS